MLTLTSEYINSVFRQYDEGNPAHLTGFDEETLACMERVHDAIDARRFPFFWLFVVMVYSFLLTAKVLVELAFAKD